MASPWHSNGPQTNPASGAVLASTAGIVGHPTHNIYFILSADVGVTIELQYLDTDLATVIRRQAIYLPANAMAEHFLPNTISDGQGYQLVTMGAVTGHVSGSLIII